MMGGMESTDRKAYLEHVNGLRGLAIAAVVLYHLQAAWCPCGYFGVDVFLVLTGYLMFLRGDRREGYGTWLHRKLWRINPPWMVAGLLTVLVSMLTMVPERLMPVLGSFGSAALGVSNEYTARSGGYFEPATQENPLMHLWYVGVTLQIYLILPLIDGARRRLGAWLWWLVAALSLALGVVVNYREEVPWLMQHGRELKDLFPPYYSIATRLWEPMAACGALLLPAWEERRSLRAGLSLFGLLLLIVPMWLSETGSPCVYPAVAGSLLLLRYGDTGPVRWLLSLRPLQAAGRISFSLYLVHWPVMALWRYLRFNQTTAWEHAGMVALSLLLAAALYTAVEKRCGGWQKRLGRRSACCMLGAMAAAAALWGLMAAFPSISRWLPGSCGDDVTEGSHPILTLRLPDADLQGFPHKVFRKRPRPLGNNTDVPVSFMLLGDSHCWHLCYGLDALCRERGTLRGMALNSSCVPAWNCYLERDNGDAQFSREYGEQLLAWLGSQKHIHTVVIADFWNLRLSDNTIRDWDMRRIPREQARAAIIAGIVEFCRRLRARGKRVIVLRDTPFFPGDKTPLDTWQRRRLLGLPEELPALRRGEWQALRERNEDLFRALQAEGFDIPDPAPVLLDGDEYRLRTRAGRFLYRDSNHLSRPGSLRVAEWLLPLLKAPENAEKAGN